MASDRASAVAFVGPVIATRPRNSSTIASSRDHIFAARPAGAAIIGSSVASGCTASISGNRSAATHIDSIVVARRARVSVEGVQRCRVTRRFEACVQCPIVCPLSGVKQT